MPPNTTIWSLLIVVLAVGSAAAGPPDLLDQAIEENNPAGDQAAEAAARLVDEADRLAEQRRFNEAIRLYERAYRLLPSDRSSYARLLVAKRAAGLMTEEDREALSLLREEQAAEVDQTFRRVRLAMIQARGAIRSGDPRLAITKIQGARASLDRMPAGIDSTLYQKALRALAKTAYRRLGTLDERTPKATASDAAHAGDRGPGRIASPRADDVLSLSENDWGADRTATGEILDVEALLAGGAERHAYDRRLAEALHRNRRDWFLRNNEAGLVPQTDMTFPDDWPQRTARRARYRDGVIYEGKPFTGPDGETYVTAIYDLSDLVHPVPNFPLLYGGGDPRAQLREDLDRQALRMRSQIFGGYARDLAEGLPLLHYFGGIDNAAISPSSDPREMERILRTLDHFVNNNQ